MVGKVVKGRVSRYRDARARCVRVLLKTTAAMRGRRKSVVADYLCMQQCLEIRSFVKTPCIHLMHLPRKQ